jgi:hypothetical protein
MFLFNSGKCASGLLSLTRNKIEHNLSCPNRMKNITRYKLFIIIMKNLQQACTNPGRQVAMATQFCAVVSHNRGASV